MTRECREYPILLSGYDRGAQPECKGGGTGRTPRKPNDQRRRPTLVLRAKIRETSRWELNPFRLGGRVKRELKPQMGRGGVVKRLFASHVGEYGSLPGGVDLIFWLVGILADDATGGRSGFIEGIFRIPRHCISALLHTRVTSPSSALKTSNCTHAAKCCDCQARCHSAATGDFVASRQIIPFSKFKEAMRSDSRGSQSCGTGGPKPVRDWFPPCAPFINEAVMISRIEDTSMADQLSRDMKAKGREGETSSNIASMGDIILAIVKGIESSFQQTEVIIVQGAESSLQNFPPKSKQGTLSPGWQQGELRTIARYNRSGHTKILNYPSLQDPDSTGSITFSHGDDPYKFGKAINTDKLHIVPKLASGQMRGDAKCVVRDEPRERSTCSDTDHPQADYESACARGCHIARRRSSLYRVACVFIRDTHSVVPTCVNNVPGEMRCGWSRDVMQGRRKREISVQNPPATGDVRRVSHMQTSERNDWERHRWTCDKCHRFCERAMRGTEQGAAWLDLALGSLFCKPALIHWITSQHDCVCACVREHSWSDPPSLPWRADSGWHKGHRHGKGGRMQGLEGALTHARLPTIPSSPSRVTNPPSPTALFRLKGRPAKFLMVIGLPSFPARSLPTSLHTHGIAGASTLVELSVTDTREVDKEKEKRTRDVMREREGKSERKGKSEREEKREREIKERKRWNEKERQEKK
ncbi:hypothetical protein PR048_001892 [Dryococelus australis]|uniref:Uncharacterized protein n=1 Tax=Dryococelus australis TaxID=614101 RepID=A0ABQ9IIL9_9NEOP|nr:hypothetical protein PR048_001892 [Dryococelus australis]